jgi:hypothetical protein
VSVFDCRKDEAIERILRFIQSVDVAPIWNTWYIGITNDASRRLYVEHKAIASKSLIIAVDSSNTARSVESYLVNHYGMDGAPGGGDNPQYVYVFKKTHDTDPYL